MKSTLFLWISSRSKGFPETHQTFRRVFVHSRHCGNKTIYFSAVCRGFSSIYKEKKAIYFLRWVLRVISSEMPEKKRNTTLFKQKRQLVNVISSHRPIKRTNLKRTERKKNKEQKTKIDYDTKVWTATKCTGLVYTLVYTLMAYVLHWGKEVVRVV